MRFLCKVAIALVMLLAAMLPAVSREEIRNFTANVTLRVDGTVQVSEMIEVNAEGVDIRRGIYRDIPTVLLGPEGNKIRANLDVISVERDGRGDEPFRTERMGNFIRIWIGDSDQMLSRGRHVYTITYTMDRMARSFADHDELYWNATGNYWIFPILNATANVTLPDGAVIADAVGYTGPTGSTEQAVTIRRIADNRLSVRVDRPLGAGEGMSFAVSFQKGVLALPTGIDALLIWLSDLRDVLLPILGVILVLAYNGTAWAAVGKDPPKGTIIPLFHPPKGFSPALVHYVHFWGMKGGGWTAFTASIFDLGVKGLVQIKNPGKTLTILATDKIPEEPLPAGENGLLSYFSAKGTVTIDKTTGTEIEAQRAALVSSIEGENRQVWFRNNTGFAVLGFLLAAAILSGMVAFDALEIEWLVGSVIVGVMLGVMFSIFRGFWTGKGITRFLPLVWIVIVGFNFAGGAIESLSGISINTAAVAAASIVLITVGFAVLMRAPTIQGRRMMDQIDGFKMYLETAEKERLNITNEPPMSVDRFERILPYAIALGVEKPWSEHFEAELARNAVRDVGEGGYKPQWYYGSGTGSFSSGRVSNTISAAATGMSAAMVAAQPVQASSSGFSGGSGGGGSSGGGGGGGGGGGW